MLERPSSPVAFGAPIGTFAQLGVPPSICRALVGRGIHEPFDIQAATIADALAGRDVSGRAPTGSGKTLAFGVPLVATVTRAEPRRPRKLVLAPTRELADQIATELRSFSTEVRVGVVYGGVGYRAQLDRFRRGVDVVVACPGRLEDLVAQNALTLKDVDKVVIDEADRMADMGFLPAVKRLLDQTSPSRQTMLFSATLDGDVADLARRYQTDPITHEIGEIAPDVTAADHRFWAVAKMDRIEASVRVITHAGPTIVFCRTRHASDRLARQLTQRGIRAAAIHGGHAQNRRTRALGQFSSGETLALVATDVAARGIHVEGIAAVIHHDPPADEKSYIHRSGRTARAGRSGLVVSILQADQVADARRIQRKLGLDIAITSPDLGPRTATPAAHGPHPQAEPSDRAHARPRARTRAARPLPGPAAKHRRVRNRRRSTSRASR